MVAMATGMMVTVTVVTLTVSNGNFFLDVILFLLFYLISLFSFMGIHSGLW